MIRKKPRQAYLPNCYSEKTVMVIYLKNWLFILKTGNIVFLCYNSFAFVRVMQGRQGSYRSINKLHRKERKICGRTGTKVMLYHIFFYIGKFKCSFLVFSGMFPIFERIYVGADFLNWHCFWNSYRICIKQALCKCFEKNSQKL